MSQALLAEGGRAKSGLAGPPDRLQGESEIGMNVGWATITPAEQIPIHIADADPAMPMNKGFDINVGRRQPIFVGMMVPQNPATAEQIG